MWMWKKMFDLGEKSMVHGTRYVVDSNEGGGDEGEQPSHATLQPPHLEGEDSKEQIPDPFDFGETEKKEPGQPQQAHKDNTNVATPPPEGKKEVDIDGVTYEIDPETGYHLLNGHAVRDEKGVPLTNRIKELERLRKENDELKSRNHDQDHGYQPQPQQHSLDSRQQYDAMMESLRAQYPGLGDEEITAMLDLSGRVVNQALQQQNMQFSSMVEENTVDHFRANVEKYPHFVDYQQEIMELFRKVPIHMRRDIQSARIALDNCRGIAIRNHLPEILNKVREDAEKSTKQNKKIIQDLGKTDGERRSPSSGRANPTLTKEQLQEAKQMGYGSDLHTYASLLEQRQKRFEKLGREKPELVRG